MISILTHFGFQERLPILQALIYSKKQKIIDNCLGDMTNEIKQTNLSRNYDNKTWELGQDKM